MNKLLSLYGRTVSLIVTVFVVSFTVLALAFLALSAMEERDQVRDLERMILVANSNVRDFIISRDPAAAKKTELILQKADRIVEDGIRAENHQKLHNEVLLYLHAVNNLIEVYQERGFYEGDGLEGQIRSRLGEIESTLISQKAHEARVELLEARRHEKNYLLREHPEYVDQVHSSIDHLMTEISNSGFSREQTSFMLEELGTYQHDFDRLVSLVERAGWITEQLDYFQTAIGSTLQHVIDVEQRRARTFLWSSLGLMLIAFVFGIVYSMQVARRILRPLEQMRTFVRKVADGEEESMQAFEQSEDSSEELIELMSSFRAVTEQVRLRREAEKELRESTTALGQYAEELEDRTQQLDQAILNLESAHDAAEKTSRQKADFLANMSHEIRTPLNGIIGMTSLLSTDDMSSDQREVVEIIRTSGESLLAIVNHVLDFSKIDAGGVSLEQEPFSIRACLEDSMSMVSKEASIKGIDLSIIQDTSLPDELIGDNPRIQQVLINLLGNAVKFTHEGEVQVRTSCTERGNDAVKLRFSIEDTGIGIKSDQLDSLFDPFTQAESSTSRRFGGTGLGLSISKRLAELMHGSMWVESTIGKGSTFHFTVELGISASAESDRKHFFVGNPRVLFLNEMPLIGRSFEVQLNEYGVLVDVACGEEEASKKLTYDEYHAVFINEGLRGFEGVAGVAVAKMLNEVAPTVPIIVLRHIHQNLGLKSTKYLLKPIRQTALWEVLNTLVNGERPLNVYSLHTDSEQAEFLREKGAPDRASIPKRAHSVLVVEDNPVNQRVEISMLENLGCEVDVVDRGEKAIEAVKNGSYSFVFMDIQMPGMDGHEATRHIRQLEGLKTRPTIIAVTAHATTEDRRRCMEAGMDDYTAKPVGSKTLSLFLERYSRPSPGSITDLNTA